MLRGKNFLVMCQNLVYSDYVDTINNVGKPQLCELTLMMTHCVPAILGECVSELIIKFAWALLEW